MRRVKNQLLLKFVKEFFNLTRPEPVVSRVGSRVPTHFDSSTHFAWNETPWVLRRGSWRLLGVLGNSPFSFLGFLLHPWRFYSFWVGEDDGLQNWRRRCEWEVQLEHGAVFKNLGRWIVSNLWFKFLPYSSIL